jgi:hypothetical protein
MLHKKAILAEDRSYPGRKHGSTGVMTRPAMCDCSDDDSIYNLVIPAAAAGISKIWPQKRSLLRLRLSSGSLAIYLGPLTPDLQDMSSNRQTILLY